MSSVAAIDLGATSGRVVVGGLDHGGLRLRHVARFSNTPVRVVDGLHWDVLDLWHNALTGLGKASRSTPDLVGVGVDSWAVDYGLLRGSRLLGNPRHYRDERTERGVEAVHAQIGPEELYRRNGLQHLPFNTVFQLAAAAGAGELDEAERMLLIPDLITYWATGAQVAERTNATTTGLVHVGDGAWDRELLTRVGLRELLLPEIVDPGVKVGAATAGVQREYGIDGPLEFSTVGSHDTASAVVGVPMVGDASAYISSGTWSLVGVELPAPVPTEQARVAGFTNEGGVDGRTRFLTNVMGLWLLSESIRHWERQGAIQDLGVLLRQAAEVPADVPTFDADDPRLLTPGDMPKRIEALLTESGSRLPTSVPEFVRSILQSLANAYTGAVHDIEHLTGRIVRTVHLVGGGAQNALLCQLTADALGVPVIAGPVEATAIGNLLVQARTHGLIPGDLEALRAVVARSFPSMRFLPRTASQRG